MSAIDQMKLTLLLKFSKVLSQMVVAIEPMRIAEKVLDWLVAPPTNKNKLSPPNFGRGWDSLNEVINDDDEDQFSAYK